MSERQEREELRTKIKKLKYKIDKEQALNAELTTKLKHFRLYASQQLSIARVLKKINFLLQVRGMLFVDWLQSCPYQEDLDIEQLIEILGRMGIKIDREEKTLLLNFIGLEMSGRVTVDDIKNLAHENGIRA